MLLLHIRAVVLLSEILTWRVGEGKGGGSRTPSQPSSPLKQQSFAPKGPPSLSRIRQNLPKPLKLNIHHDGAIARIHRACSVYLSLQLWYLVGRIDRVQSAIHSQLGRAENAKFIEHFRYILVASQLLTEHYGQQDSRATPSLGPNIHPEEFKAVTTSVAGAVVTATTAFALVWLIHWSRDGKTHSFHKGRVSLVIMTFILVGTVLYAYARRQWLLFLRQQAVSAGSTLATNLHAFNSSSAAGLMLIQEVELVSRGYRLSQPLPPITRLEEKDQRRRCSRLRKALKSAFAACMPVIEDGCVRLRHLITEDDLEKYLDVYEIGPQDVQEATIGFQADEFEDNESLKALRMWQYRFSVLRKVFLCSLLSLEADGGRSDFGRWRTAVEHMERVAIVTGESAEKINLILQEEEQFSIPQTPQRSSSLNPERERIRNQVRKLSSLSSGIRGLQAKMQILREESSKALEESDDFIELGNSLLSQYDSIGTDLKALVQAWEAGRSSLVLNLERQERRVSQASSSLRSPTTSLGGLTAVDESSGGSPSDALRALEGAGHVRADSSMSSASPSAASNSDEEIFEAIAIPRQRLTREEKMVRMAEERGRMASARERREQGASMIRELESVMKQRPLKRMSMPAPGGRVTSM